MEAYVENYLASAKAETARTMMVLSLQEVLWVLEIKRIDLRMNVNVRKPTLAHFRMILNIKYVPLVCQLLVIYHFLVHK